MQYNIVTARLCSDCSCVPIILTMASLDSLFLCSVGQHIVICSELVLKFFAKIKAFVLLKLFI